MVKRTALAKRSRNSSAKKNPAQRRNSKRKNRNSFGNISALGVRPRPLMVSFPTTPVNKYSPRPSNPKAKNCIIEKPNTKLIPMDVCGDSNSESVISISDSSSDESNLEVKEIGRDNRKDDSCFIIDVEPTDLNEKTSFYEYVDNIEVSENQNGECLNELLKPRSKNRLIEKIYPSLNDETFPSSTSSENPVEAYVINETIDNDDARSFEHTMNVNSNPSLEISNDSNKSENYLNYNGLEQLTGSMRKEFRKKIKKGNLKNRTRQIPLMSNTDDELGPDDEFGPGDCDPDVLCRPDSDCGSVKECNPKNDCSPNDVFVPDDEFSSGKEFGPCNECPKNSNDSDKLTDSVVALQNKYVNSVNVSDTSPFSLVNNWINKINQNTPYQDLVKQTSFKPIIPVVNRDKQAQNIPNRTVMSNTIIDLDSPVRNLTNPYFNSPNSRQRNGASDKQTDIARKTQGVNTDQLINCIETITNINTDVNPHTVQPSVPCTIDDNSDKPSTSYENMEIPTTSNSSDPTRNHLPQTFIALEESSDSDIEFVDEYNPHDHLIELSDEDLPDKIPFKTSKKPAQKKTKKKNPKQKKKSLTKKKDEKKQSEENAKNELEERLRPIVIDGCNVGMGHSRSKNLSVEGIKICYDYFIKKGHEVKIFLPQNKKYHPLTTDTKQLEKWEREGVVIFTPGRKVNGICIYSYDDRFILEYAALKGAIVITRDNYRDLYAERTDFRDTILNRLLQYTFVDDLIMFPSDPLGRNGPHLDKFLKFPPTKGQQTGSKPKGPQVTK